MPTTIKGLSLSLDPFLKKGPGPTKGSIKLNTTFRVSVSTLQEMSVKLGIRPSLFLHAANKKNTRLGVSHTRQRVL